MGLRWEQRQPTKRWFGYDVEGDVYALVERRPDGWRLHLTEPGSGAPGGTWLPESWPTSEEAMLAGDRFVIAYVDLALLEADPSKAARRASDT